MQGRADNGWTGGVDVGRHSQGARQLEWIVKGDSPPSANKTRKVETMSERRNQRLELESVHPTSSTTGVATSIFMSNGRVKIESVMGKGDFRQLREVEPGPSFILPEQWPAVKAFIDQQLADYSQPEQPDDQ